MAPATACMTEVTNRGDASHDVGRRANNGPTASHNGPMSAAAIEPGVLRVFRAFVGFRLALLVVMNASLENRADTELLLVPGPGVVVFGFLLVYLLAQPLRDALGRAYLPIGLAIAAISPILENGVAVARRIERGDTAYAVVADYWVLVFVLFVPLLIVAWQYRYRVVLLFAVGTTLLDAVVLLPQLATTNASPQIVGALLVGRGALFAFVGVFIAQLATRQREQRVVIARHATTLEQLATSRERNRLARELHDTLAHALSAVAVQLEGARSVWDEDPSRAKAMVERSLEGTRTGLTEARRAIQALRASPLEELGLAAAIERLGADASASSSMNITLDISGDLDELDPDVEQAAYRIVDEALVNAMRHSGAESVTVQAMGSGRTLSVQVSDDGTGFDAHQPSVAGHHGVTGMIERAELVGGTLRIDSGNGGTTVTFEVGA